MEILNYLMILVEMGLIKGKSSFCFERLSFEFINRKEHIILKLIQNTLEDYINT